MIQYQEKGYHMIEYLESNGVYLYQLDNVWCQSSNLTDDEVNTLIDEYNPWPGEKARKLAEINETFKALVDQLVAGTTPDERNSWDIQEKEALGYVADNNYPVPALTTLAAFRGITLEQLVAKVIQKSDLYKQYYFTFQGLRDAAEDKIKALPDSGSYDRLPELHAIEMGV